jgi:predicted ATP-grasp superfamily ATP-dependent carboligase
MSDSVVLVGMNIRPLARSAVKAGWEVTAIGVVSYLDMPAEVRYLSLMDDLGGIFPPDPDDFHARIGRAAGELDVASAAYSGGFENFPGIIGEMNTRFELLGNGPETLNGVRSPFRLKEAAASVGVKTPRILAAGESPDPQVQWLKKMVRSGAGGGIEPWDGVFPEDQGFIIQERIAGPPQSVSFIANGKEARVFAFSEQLIGDPAFGGMGYRYIGNLVMPPPDPVLMAKMEKLANTLTRTFGLVGLNGIDFILHDGEPYILEVNPRYSASMELYEDALGQSL